MCSLLAVHRQHTPAFREEGASFGDTSFGDETNHLDDNDKVEDKTLLLRLGTFKQDKVSFQFVAKKATNLVCMAQSDQTTLGSSNPSLSCTGRWASDHDTSQEPPRTLRRLLGSALDRPFWRCTCDQHHWEKGSVSWPCVSNK
jgi:hypothetical protein